MEVIGSNIYVEIVGRQKVPAKVDTGADSTAIWASDIQVTKDGILKFKLFGPGSPFYNGKVIKRKDYKLVVTRSSHGDEKIFYRTYIPVCIQNHKIKALFTLADRSRNNFPILIGRRTIKGKFIVDVRQHQIPLPDKIQTTATLNDELKLDPYVFHQKYAGCIVGSKK